MKLKTRKSAFKRIKKKKNVFIRKCANRAHFLRRKSARQQRNLSQTKRIRFSDVKAIRHMLPYQVA